MVLSQFDVSMLKLQGLLANKKGLQTFLIGMLESGKLEEAYNRQMAAPVVHIPTFGAHAKFIKQAGLIWCRELLQAIEPAFKLAPDHTAEDSKLVKLDNDKAVVWVCLALRIDKDCWLLHKHCAPATEIAIQRYSDVGKPLCDISYKDSITEKGFYKIDGNTVVCSALSTPIRVLFIDIPDHMLPLHSSWTFQQNWHANASLAVTEGDQYILLTRFKSKYPDIFTDEVITPARSLEADGVAPPPSLGDVRRAVPKTKAKNGPTAVAAVPSSRLSAATLAALPPVPPILGGAATVLPVVPVPVGVPTVLAEAHPSGSEQAEEAEEPL
jgi:hypothetical protein